MCAVAVQIGQHVVEPNVRAAQTLLFEAGCSGKPVVATGYPGPLDFLDLGTDSLAHHDLRDFNNTDG
jgi:glycosyltransferase involved in cell wall biosynthesis